MPIEGPVLAPALISPTLMPTYTLRQVPLSPAFSEQVRDDNHVGSGGCSSAFESG